MLSRTAEYALRAIVWLSDHPESSVTGQAIAAATQVPPDYLSKVMQCLVRAGLVEAQRGKNGGFSLVSNPDDLTILDGHDNQARAALIAERIEDWKSMANA